MANTTHQQHIGRWGETIAAHFLEQNGYGILDRNARTPHGEIDLVASQARGRAEERIIVFVEVKTRTTANFGLPEEAVDTQKLQHLFFSAENYIHNHPDLEGLEWRIDAIAIQGRPGAKVEDVHIEHFENISA